MGGMVEGEAERTVSSRGMALVTGASAGIGRELARVLAEEGWDLIITARSTDRLQALAEAIEDETGQSVEVIPCDLADPGGPGRLVEEVRARDLRVEILVNNAGFGDHGPFVDADLTRNLDMIQVNVTAVMELTHRLLPELVEAGRGRILNVASTAAFQPGPFMSVYYATKAYVLSFSEALREELRQTGVTVTTLCPGPTESEFQEVAGIEETTLVRLSSPPSSRTVAEYGVAAMLRGRGVAVQGMLNRFLVFMVGLAPRGVVVRVVRRLNDVRS